MTSSRSWHWNCGCSWSKECRDNFPSEGNTPIATPSTASFDARKVKAPPRERRFGWMFEWVTLRLTWNSRWRRRWRRRWRWRWRWRQAVVTIKTNEISLRLTACCALRAVPKRPRAQVCVAVFFIALAFIFDLASVSATVKPWNKSQNALMSLTSLTAKRVIRLLSNWTSMLMLFK